MGVDAPTTRPDRFAGDVQLNRVVDGGAKQGLGERPIYMDDVVIRRVLPARDADGSAIAVLRIEKQDVYVWSDDLGLHLLKMEVGLI